MLVRASFDASRQRYGSPRIHEDLHEQQERVSRKRVIRLMQDDGLQARARKRYKVTTMSEHDQPVAANLLDRQFAAAAPNQRWVGDTTEFVIGEQRQALSRGGPGPVLAVHRRLGAQRRERSASDHQGAGDGAEAPVSGRSGCCITPTRAARTRARTTRTSSRRAGIVCSMSRRGNCYDNAVMESFFSTVKSELGERFDSHGEAKMELFDYIEVFYNQRRRHSTLGQISPAAFERRAREEGMDAMENRPDRGFPPRPHPSMFQGQKTEDQRKPLSQTVHRIGSSPGMMIVAGDNPTRVRSEAAFAKLCGACPIPASSGVTHRHRLFRGGHRQANAAL